VPAPPRNVVLLAVCQALFMTCTSLIAATAPLVGVALAPRAGLATVPMGLLFVAVMATTLPASLLMRRVGRRNGLLAGALAGVAGASLATAGIVAGSFAAFCAGMMGIGVFSAFSQYFRFAAADAAPDGYKARAISLVMAGGVVAAFIGPNLARATREALPVSFAGGYLSVALTAALCAAVVSAVRIPPAAGPEAGGPARPLRRIAASPVYLVAVLGGIVAYGSMNLLMTSTPLAMHAYGHPFDDTAIVIQWHVFAMFAPSFVTGRVIQRLGVLTVMASGALLLSACVAVNLAGTGFAHFWSALALLGVGWNFLFVGATTLLTEAYAPAEKAKAQGVNDLLVFSMVALTAFSSGALHAAVGWTTLNLAVLPALLLVAAACAALGLARRRGAAAPIAPGPGPESAR